MARPTSQKTVVSRLFLASERPIYVLDASGRIVFTNKALADWLSIDEDRLFGMKCVWAGTNSENMVSRLAVPPQAKDLADYQCVISMGTGKSRSHRYARFLALNEHADLGATLVLLDEVDSDVPSYSPFDAEALHRELLELRQTWSEPFVLDQIVGNSAAIRQVRSQVSLAANSTARVVLVGPDGTGRELIARTIHQERSQGLHALIPLHCTLLTADLLQAAISDLLKQCDDSADLQQATLLLLEVDTLSVEAQTVLLSHLVDSEPRFLTITTTQEPLLQGGQQQRFQIDLAHLLTDIEIRLPALTDRLDDIPLLAQWSLERTKYANRRAGFTADAVEALLRYPWPGEVDELLEVVEESAAAAGGSLITTTDLPDKFQFAADAAALPDIPEEKLTLDEFMAEVETELIERAIKQAKGNRAQAARMLGVSRGKLLRRIQQLGIDT